jgi:hypothetical protein
MNFVQLNFQNPSNFPVKFQTTLYLIGAKAEEFKNSVQ